MSKSLKLKSEVYIANRRIADDEPVYIIGEIACGHQGDIEQAFQLVDAAVKAKADCVQLQIFDTDSNMAPTADSYPLLQKLQFTKAQWQEIMAHARQFDIHVSIFAYDEPSLEFAIDLKPEMLKLNSSELSNPPMLVGAAQSGLPFTLGTGASNLEEIAKAVDIILSNGGYKVILMHGVQNFPTSIASANIRKISRLKHEFGGLVIFADHTDATNELSQYIDLVAIGQGAALLEKHLVLDRSTKGVDWQAAQEPSEFAKYVEVMRQSYSALGSYNFLPFTEDEKKYRRFQKKSLVAARDLDAGVYITQREVKFLRVQSKQEGIAPDMFALKVLGKKLSRDVKAFEQISFRDLAD